MKLQKEERQLANLTSNPPNMPMVLDENVIEDILGVTYSYLIFISQTFQSNSPQAHTKKQCQSKLFAS